MDHLPKLSSQALRDENRAIMDVLGAIEESLRTMRLTHQDPVRGWTATLTRQHEALRSAQRAILNELAGRFVVSRLDAPRTAYCLLAGGGEWRDLANAISAAESIATEARPCRVFDGNGGLKHDTSEGA